MTNITRTITGRKNSKLITIEPNFYSIEYFADKFSIELARSLIHSLLETCSNKSKQSKWLGTLNDLINTYVTIVNQLSQTINYLQQVGIFAKLHTKIIKQEVKFIDFAKYKTFLEDCDSVFLSISSERNDEIAIRLDTAANDTQRYIKAIKDVEDFAWDFKENSKGNNREINACMQELKESLCEFQNIPNIQKANKTTTLISDLKRNYHRISSMHIYTTLESAILTLISSLNAAHETLSLSLMHLLPRKSD